MALENYTDHAPVSQTGATRPGRRSPLLRVGFSIATIVVLMLWILGAFRREDIIQPGTQPAPEQSAAGLPTQNVGMQTISADTEAVGTIQAEQTATVTSRVVANVLEVRTAAGQRVPAGAVLMVLDDRDLRQRFEQAQDAVRSAEATAAQARADYTRDKPLFDQQVITAYEFEHTGTNLRVGEANLHRLQQAAREAEVNLSYAVVRSPFAGMVIDTLANVGDMAAPGKPLLTMYAEGRLRLEANVPEDLMDEVRVGQQLTFRIDALSREARGRVAAIVPSSDPSSRTVAVRVHLDDTKDALPGMFGRVLIPSKAEQVLAVPASTLVRAGQLTMVDVVREARVERRTVQLGRAIGSQFEVVAGLAPGEAVVLRGGGSQLGSQYEGPTR